MLDPQAQLVLDLVTKAGRPAYHTLPAAEARRMYRETRGALAPDAPALHEVRDLAAGGVPARLYRPGAGTLPGLVFLHGGGFTIGDLDTHDVLCRQLALAGGCAVLSVDYRMGPEHRFPAAVEDAWAATRWAAANAAELGLDAARLAVGGDSAGGNLAAVVALLARDAGAPAFKLQLLIYPATDTAHDMPSHRRLHEGYLLTGELIAWFRGNYLRGPEDMADWRASPLRAPRHDGLAPAWILTAGYDPIQDEGRAYAEALRAAGVPATLREYPGMIHGFILMGRVIAAANRAVAEAGAALRTAFGTSA